VQSHFYGEADAFHVILAQTRTWDLVDLLFVLRDQCKAVKRPNKQPERGHDWSGCGYPKHLARLVVAKARKPLWTVVVISFHAVNCPPVKRLCLPTTCYSSQGYTELQTHPNFSTVSTGTGTVGGVWI
jgi:hypothetical protein